MSFDIVKRNREEDAVVDLREASKREKKNWGAVAFILGIFFSVLFLIGGGYYVIKNNDSYVAMLEYLRSHVVETPQLDDGPIQIDKKDEVVTSNIPKSENENDKKDAEFRLVIDTKDLHINAPVIEGANKENLSQGVGHHRTTAEPGFSGNVVIYGHRWYPGDNPYYTIFNHLELLKAGDKVTIYYKGGTFVYQIKESKIVLSDQVEILKQTDRPQLTLYTCTPRYTSEKRLVYIGELVSWNKLGQESQ